MTTRAEDKNIGLASDDTARVVLASNQPAIPVSLLASINNATTTAYAASLLVKAAPGVLYSITGYNSKTSGQFIQIHDSANIPADATVPKIIFYVPPQSNFAFDTAPFGRAFTVGIVICNSSTGPTKTLGSADCWFDVQYT